MQTWSLSHPRTSGAHLRTAIPTRYGQARSRVLAILARWDREVARTSALQPDRSGRTTGFTAYA